MLDYWSDRESFQWRILNDDGKPHDYMTDSPPRIVHPDTESLPDDLPKALNEHLVITGRGQGQPFRIWMGSKQAPLYSYHRALISFQPPIVAGTVDFFPPLALPESDWKGTVHRMDQFFAPGHGRAEWIGTMMIDGVETQVVTKAWRPVGSLPKEIWLVIRAFVDMNRGGIPLRVEGFAGTDKDLDVLFAAKALPLTGDAPPLPNWIIRDVEIKEIAPGMYYPMRGFEDQLTRAGENIDVKTKPRSVLHQTTEWRAFRVEANRKMTPAMFEMKFPGNTVLRDATTNETWLTGDANEHAERVVNRAMPKVGNKWWWNAGLVVGGCVAALGLVWFVSKRWRRRVA